MIEMTFEQVVQAARRLRPEQQAALVKSLQVEPVSLNLTRRELLAELRALRSAGAFDRVTSLRNRFANPSLAYVSDEQLLAVIHEAAAEWEPDLEEHSGHGH